MTTITYNKYKEYKMTAGFIYNSGRSFLTNIIPYLKLLLCSRTTKRIQIKSCDYGVTGSFYTKG